MGEYATRVQHLRIETRRQGCQAFCPRDQQLSTFFRWNALVDTHDLLGGRDARASLARGIPSIPLTCPESLRGVHLPPAYAQSQGPDLMGARSKPLFGSSGPYCRPLGRRGSGGLKHCPGSGGATAAKPNGNLCREAQQSSPQFEIVRPGSHSRARLAGLCPAP
jgi:hypothetical protein